MTQMINKTFSLLGLSVLSLILLMSFASAAVNFISVSGDTQSINQGSTATVSFQLQESGFGNLTNMSFNVPLTLTSGANTLVSASSVTGAINSLNQGMTSGTMTLTFSVPSTQALGTYTGNLTLSGKYINNVNFDLPLTITVTAISLNEPIEVISCTNLGNPGDLRVKKIDFKNDGMSHKEFGDDDQWFPLDEVEIEIEIKNDGNEDVDDIEVEWGIYDTRQREMIIDFDDEKDFNLKDGKDKVLTVNFQLEDDLDVDLEDLSDGENYRFYVIATGRVDNQTADRTCVSDFEDAEIVIEDDFVVLDNIQLPETLMCGETIRVSADVWNIGDGDQDEVSVEVFDKERKLGLRELVEIGDIDAFDNDNLDFTFEVPKDADEQFYSLVFRVLDEDGDVYENDFDDDESEFTVSFRVEGGCDGVSGSGEVLVSAGLESGGKAGQALTVRATITNTRDELKSFTVNAAGFAQWASSFNVDRRSIVLGAGQSEDVLFTFDVNRDASGSQSFIIELVSENNQVTTQPVSVSIEGRSGFLGLTGSATSGSAYLWGIGILNIILVIVIIIVAVRVARK